MVEFGLRLTYSIGVIAALSFLGFGLQPPTADWGLMINENRLAIDRPAVGASLLPVLAIALLTIGTNLITDGVSRAAIGLDRGGEHDASPRPPPTDAVDVEGLRIELIPDAASDIVDEIVARRSAPARCSASSASRARARRPSGWRCSATRRRGAQIDGGRDPHRRPRPVDAAAGRAARSCAEARSSYVPQDPGTALNPALRIGDAARRDARGPRGRRPSAEQRERAPPRDARGGARCPATTRSCAATRTSSPAASSSASRSRWPSPAARA